MQEVKTIDLTGPALDWAIAQIEGVEVAIYPPQYQVGWLVARPYPYGKYSPSTEWVTGGPLLERHHIELSIGDEDYWAERTSTGPRDEPRQNFAGPTMLIAACRAIVSAELGDTVQVPAELLTPTPK